MACLYSADPSPELSSSVSAALHHPQATASQSAGARSDPLEPGSRRPTSGVKYDSETITRAHTCSGRGARRAGCAGPLRSAAGSKIVSPQPGTKSSLDIPCGFMQKGQLDECAHRPTRRGLPLCCGRGVGLPREKGRWVRPSGVGVADDGEGASAVRDGFVILPELAESSRCVEVGAGGVFGLERGAALQRQHLLEVEERCVRLASADGHAWTP